MNLKKKWNQLKTATIQFVTSHQRNHCKPAHALGPGLGLNANFYIVDSDSKNCIQFWIVDWIVSVFDLRAVILQQVFKCKDWLILDCNLPGVRPAGCWKSCYISLPLWCDGQELGAGLNIDHVRLERENITCYLLHGPDIQLSFAPRTKNQR